MSEVRTHVSKDDDHFGNRKSEAKLRSILEPRSLSLIDALELVEEDRMSAEDLYDQMPPQLSAVVDKAAQAGYKCGFRLLSSGQQKQIMQALSSAIRASADASPSAQAKHATAAASSKPWWKFW